MIHILDLSSSGSTHVMFNASICKVLSAAYPFAELTFYSEGSHQNIVNTYFSAEEKERMCTKIISLKTIKKTNKITKLQGVLKKTWNDLVLLCGLLRTTSDKDLIFISKAHPLTLLCFKWQKRFYPRVPVIAVLHGELEFLYSATDTWEENMALLYKRILATKAVNFRYLLLNKISRQRLIQDNLMKPDEVYEIDHPYPFTLQVQTKALSDSLAIKIGHVGSLGKRKNAHLIYALANNLSQQILLDQLEFWAVGPIEENALPYKNDYVLSFDDGNSSNYISREIYEERLKNLDYAIFFYSKNQFIFRASGAILDVIEHKKPIIALKHPVFDYLTAQAGNIGFICDDIAAMTNVIARLAKRDVGLTNQYYNQCENLRLYKESHNISAIAVDLRKQSHY